MSDLERRFVGTDDRSIAERLDWLETDHLEKHGGELRQPPEPDPDSFSGQVLAGQRRKAAQNVAEAEARNEAIRAEKERQAAEAAAELLRQHQIWRDNRGRRQRALLAIDEIDPKIAKVHERYLELRDQRSALRDIVNTGIRPEGE